MSSYKQLNQIKESGKSLLTTDDIRQILEIEVDRTLEDLIRRLLEQDVLMQLEKGKYALKNANVSDFDMAQFLYSPSYISFETALNYHGILSQFPMEITSATTKRTTDKEVLGKVFTYAHLSTKLFVGYYKDNDALIAQPEKALFDQLYMISKGLKTEQYLDEMDFTGVDQQKVERYLVLLPNKVANQISSLTQQYL